MRSFFAVLAGFVTVPIIAVSADNAFHAIHPAFGPDSYISGGTAVIVLLYSTFAVWLGGYITGMIARSRQVMLGVILGCIGFLISIVVDILLWHHAAAWYYIIGLVTVVPVSAWGAHVAGKRYERKTTLIAGS